MKGKNFNEFLDEITQEFNNDTQQHLEDINIILRDWEEAIKNSHLSTEELLIRHYRSLTRHRISRLRKLLDIVDCPEFVIIRELTLCQQPYKEFLESTYAKRIIELRG